MKKGKEIWNEYKTKYEIEYIIEETKKLKHIKKITEYINKNCEN